MSVRERKVYTVSQDDSFCYTVPKSTWRVTRRCWRVWDAEEFVKFRVLFAVLNSLKIIELSNYLQAHSVWTSDSQLECKSIATWKPENEVIWKSFWGEKALDEDIIAVSAGNIIRTVSNNNYCSFNQWITPTTMGRRNTLLISPIPQQSRHKPTHDHVWNSHNRCRS